MIYFLEPSVVNMQYLENGIFNLNGSFLYKDTVLAYWLTTHMYQRANQRKNNPKANK